MQAGIGDGTPRAPDPPRGTSAPPAAPIQATSVDDIAAGLCALRAWHGNPSYAELTRRVRSRRLARGVPPHEASPGRTTVYDCFRKGRRRLDAELVVDIVTVLGVPKPQLAGWRNALRAVLSPTTIPVAEVTFGPAALPSVFVGRSREVRRVADAVVAGRHALIEGMPGSGKSTLADAAADDLLARGIVTRVLRAELRSSEGELVEDSVAVDNVVEECVRQLRPGQPMRGDPAHRRAVFDRLLSAEPCLLILDNARSVGQVRGLLPPPPSRAVVTSRCRLDGLDAAVETVLLRELELPDAHQLLARASGGSAAADDPTTLSALCVLAGLLPLPLTLLARRMADRPGWSAKDHLAAYLDRLHVLRLEVGVEASIAVSYAALDPADRATMRTLCLNPGQDLSTDAAAVLCDRPPADCAESLRRLERAHLIRTARPGHWEAHALIKTFGLRRALDEDRPSDRRDRRSRLLDHYLDQTMRAVRVLHPDEASRWYWTGPLDPGPADAPGSAPEPAAALEWLNAERVNLLDSAVWAVSHDEAERGTRLGAALTPYLLDRGEAETMLALHRAMRAAAFALGDPDAEALAEQNLTRTLSRGMGQRMAFARFHRLIDPEPPPQLPPAVDPEAQASGHELVVDQVGVERAAHEQLGVRPHVDDHPVAHHGDP